MGMSGRLLFDVNNPNDTSNVGAYLRASDGTLIDKQTLNSTQWIQAASAMFDGTGANAITSTTVSGKQGLDVNLIDGSISVDLNGIYNSGTNPNPDNVGAILFNRAASPGLSDQLFTPTGGVASSDAVVDANVHGADVNGFMMGFNGTTWDRLQVDGSKFLKVNIAAGSVTVNDAALANTDLANAAISIGLTSTALVASPLSARKYLNVYNNANHPIYIGKGTVTSTNGYPIFPGVAAEFRAGAALSINAISTAAAQDIRTLEFS